MAYTGSPSYPSNAPAGSSQANAAMPGYGPQLHSGFSYAAGLADAVRNAASFFGNIFSFGTLGGSAPSTSGSPTAAPTAATSPTSTTTPGATTPREAAAARTGPPAQPTYSVTGTAGKTGTTTAAPAAAVPTDTTAPSEKPGAGAMSAMGYAAGLGVSPPSSGIGAATAPTDISNFTDTKFGDAADFTPSPAAAVPGAGVEAAHQAISATPKTDAAAPPVATPGPLTFEDPFSSGKLDPAVAEKYATGHVPVSIRNNNPSAISITGKVPGSFGATQTGFVGTSPRPKSEGGLYAKYATPEDGVAAASKLLENYGAQGINTANSITRKWAVDNTGYAADVARFTGKGIDEPLDLTDPNVRAQILMAQSAHESGFGRPVYKSEVYTAGVNYTGGSRFRGAPGTIDPFANATTYGAGGPATGGNFTRDPQGNPVPPANIPGGSMPTTSGGADFSIPGAGFGQPETYAGPAAGKPAAPAAPAAAPATTGKQPSLKIGSSGPAVRDLQTQLLAAGYNPGPIDGNFGQRTRDALYQFQQATPGTGSRFGQSDTIAGPKVQAALAAANPYRDIQPPEDIVVQPPGGYAAGITPGITPAAFNERFGPTPVPSITPAAFNERFGPTMAPAAAAPALGGTQVFGPGQTGEPAPQPAVGPNFDETFNAPMPLPGQELTPEQGAGTMATRADLRDRLPGAAATAGAGYYRGLQSVEEDRASRARIPETVASTYAAITGGGGTDQFAGGPTGGLPAPALGREGQPVPTPTERPYRDPGLVSPDEAANVRGDFERLRAASGVPTPPQRVAQGREGFAVPNPPQRPAAPYQDPGLVSPDEAARARQDFERLKAGGAPSANAGPAAAGAAALTAPEPDVVRTLASLPPEGQAQYRSGFVNNIIDSIDQAGDARSILKAIDASPQASRRLEVVLGPQGASQFKSLVRVDGIGNREPGTRFASALPSMAGLRGSPPVDSQVAARVGAMLDSENADEFSRGLKIVASNPALEALVRRVDAMV